MNEYELSESIEKYIAQLGGVNPVTVKITKANVLKGVVFFNGRGIEWPNDDDYSAFEEYQTSKYSGATAPKNARAVVSVTRRFYEWLKKEVGSVNSENEVKSVVKERKKETKSQRVNFLISEKDYYILKNVASLNNETVTDAIIRGIKEYLNKHVKDVEYISSRMNDIYK